MPKTVDRAVRDGALERAFEQLLFLAEAVVARHHHKHTGACYGAPLCWEHHIHDERCGSRPLTCGRSESWNDIDSLKEGIETIRALRGGGR